ncbi:nucleotidyl transferase AbiEii/AbiGii toxin family protein [Vibrio harveyi]
MTDIYTLKNSLPLEFEKALSKVIKAVSPLDVPYFIAGATARDIVLHGVFGHPPIRATRDIDTALLVSSWDEFESIKQSLLSSGLEETEQAHRLKEPESGLPIDIIPFGDLADPKGQIQWPPSHDITMSVVGFKEAYDTAITIDFHGQYLKVASLPGITMLKLMAWDERGDESHKDATDFYTVLSKYELIHDGRLWEDYVPGEALNYDIKKQGAFLLGFDLRDLMSGSTQKILKKIKEEKQDAFITAITRTHKTAQVDEVEGQLEAFWMGVDV